MLNHSLQYPSYKVFVYCQPMKVFVYCQPMKTVRYMLSLLITISVVCGVTLGIRKDCDQAPCFHVPQEVHHTCPRAELQFFESQVTAPRYSDQSIAASWIIQWIDPISFRAPITDIYAFEHLHSIKVSTVARHIATTVIIS